MADGIEIIAIGTQSVRFQDHESRYNERTRAEKGARPRVSIFFMYYITSVESAAHSAVSCF